MIKVTSKDINGIYDSIVEVFGPSDEVLVELNHLFYSIIKSNNPEIIYAVIAYYLPEITLQITRDCTSVTKISQYMVLLQKTKLEDCT